MAKQYRLVLADDHVLVRQGLKRILEDSPDLEVVGEAGDGLELLGLLGGTDPDMVILDVSMPNMRGIEAIPEIRRLRPGIKVLVLSMYNEEEFLYQAISAGADGYLLKEDAQGDLFSAIEGIRRGRVCISPGLKDRSMRNWAAIRRGERRALAPGSLTVRQREILKLIAEGRSNKEIGDLLCISVRTVERHRANMMARLHVRRTADLVRYALCRHYV